MSAAEPLFDAVRELVLLQRPQPMPDSAAHTHVWAYAWAKPEGEAGSVFEICTGCGIEHRDGVTATIAEVAELLFGWMR